MIIVNLKGGLGNQMFQYAFGKSLSLKLGVPLKLDVRFLLDRNPSLKHIFRDFDLSIFNLELSFATKEEIEKVVKMNFLQKIYRRKINLTYKIFIENYFHYDPRAEKLKDNIYLDGYWQSPKYFISHEAQIKNKFKFTNVLTEQKLVLKNKIISSDSVCVNIRRTDYLTTSASVYGNCNQSYYINGLEIIKQKLTNRSIELFVFSDDIEWCKKNLKFSLPTTFVNHDFSGVKFQDYLQLMSLCKHFLIPNSTFAWWAAYLSEQDINKIVIAPKIWFTDMKINTNDLIPDQWIRI
jgi:hypothetical protein